MVKKSLDAILKVYADKISGPTPYGFVDGLGMSVRSFDALHTLHISGDMNDVGGQKRICLAGVKMVSSVAGAFDYVTFGTDGKVELGVLAKDAVPMNINVYTVGNYINLLAEMQNAAREDSYKECMLFIEKQVDYEKIADKLLDMGAILTYRDFKTLDALSFLTAELDVTVYVDAENNDFVVQSKFFTYMTKNSREA